MAVCRSAGAFQKIFPQNHDDYRKYWTPGKKGLPDPFQPGCGESEQQRRGVLEIAGNQ